MITSASREGKLRILHVCPRPSFSGLEAYALAMGTAQRDLGHDIRFLTLTDSPLEKRCREAGLPVMSVGDSFSAKLALTVKLASYFHSRETPDLIHLHSTQDLDLMIVPIFLSIWPMGRKPKIVLQTHIWISHAKRDPLHAISYSLVNEVWCSSEPARKTLEKFLPIPKRKIRVLNYGRESAKIEAGFLSRAAAREHLGIRSEATLIGTVARIDEGKGTRELLEASLSLMEQHADLELILIGPPTADDPRAIAFAEMISARIHDLPPHLKSRVHAPGAVPDSYRFLKAFDLFVLPTYMECFALSLLEAQLAQLPCLATNTGGSSEVVRENETGWLFEPRSVDSLKSALERALNERARWSEFGERARERIRKDFDFDRILPTTLDFYREICGIPRQ